MKFSLLLASQIFLASAAVGADAPASQPTAPSAPQAAPAEAQAAATAAEASNGSESVCKLSGNTRRVKMDLSQQKCQVLYYKETEKPGTEDKLWEYNHEFDKCKESYSNFVEKLRGLSWTCN